MALGIESRFMFGRRADGQVLPLAVDDNGYLRITGASSTVAADTISVVSTPIGHDIAAGLVPGITAWSKIGYNGDIDNAQESLWTVGGMYVFPPLGGIQMQIVSAAAGDTAAGAGVQSVRIGYLDNLGVSRSETKATNGGTVQTTATNIWRVNSFRAVTCGATGRAAGNISLQSVGGGVTYTQIALGQSRARNSSYTVPAGYWLNIESVAVGAVAAGTNYGLFTLYASYDENIGALSFMQPWAELSVQNSSTVREFSIPLRFPQWTDLYVACISNGAAANVLANSAARGFLEAS